ncbi:MAG: DUF2274 domain-containing protein [Pseudomonadota bacterium]
MTTPKLKIGPLPDTTPVKLTLSIDPDLQSDLDIYAKLYERAYGEKASVAAIVPSMLRTFLSGDSGFKKARRETIRIPQSNRQQ